MPTLKIEIQKKWKSRKNTAHKGDYGRVLILAGSKDYSGAAYLAGAACLRAGAGLVTLGVPDSIHSIVARRQPELIVKAFRSTPQGSLAFKNAEALLKLIKTQDILVLGPGLSQNPETQKLILEIIKKNKKPVIIDADGLNALAKNPKTLLPNQAQSILTPHPGEFVRLFGGPLTSADPLRKKRAREAAKKFGCVIILKGHHTVAAHPDGSIYVNSTGNPGMATAGTGDVLSGVLAALLGQNLSLWDSARFGVYLHGLAGDLAAKKFGKISLIAGDLLEFIPQAIQKTLSK